MFDKISFSIHCEARAGFKLVWILPTSITDLGSFLYWALSYGARYEVIAALDIADNLVGLHPVAGCPGESYRRLFHDLKSGDFYWFCQASTFSLTHDGLDNVPSGLLAQIPLDTPLFRVEAPGGLFQTTYSDWSRYAGSGRDSSDLSDLSIWRQREDLPLQQSFWSCA
jgi:hypothetical protein